MKKYKNTTALLLAILFSSAACSSDDTIKAKPDIEIAQLQAMNVTVEDISNKGNPSDVRVSFQKAEQNDLIAKYYIIYQSLSNSLTGVSCLCFNFHRESQSRFILNTPFDIHGFFREI